jgi:Domain of unknown function (DUF4262)
MNEEKLKQIDEKLANDIEKYGLQVLHVFADETGPGFSYSIGLFETYNHPEILIIGLKQELLHRLINNMAEDIKNGKTYIPLNFYPDILDGFLCYIVKVDADYYDAYVGQAQRYYQEVDFPLIQCIYPTVKGIYPWEKDWPEEIKDLEPILGEVKLG